MVIYIYIKYTNNRTLNFKKVAGQSNLSIDVTFSEVRKLEQLHFSFDCFLIIYWTSLDIKTLLCVHHRIFAIILLVIMYCTTFFSQTDSIVINCDFPYTSQVLVLFYLKEILLQI